MVLHLCTWNTLEFRPIGAKTAPLLMDLMVYLSIHQCTSPNCWRGGKLLKIQYQVYFYLTCIWSVMFIFVFVVEDYKNRLLVAVFIFGHLTTSCFLVQSYILYLEWTQIIPRGVFLSQKSKLSIVTSNISSKWGSSFE